MTCDTEHTAEVIQSGQCGDCGQLWCPNCEAAITLSDRRYEEEPRAWDYPGSFTVGCKHCLKGRHVYLYPAHAQALADAEVDRRLDEQREGVEPL